MVTAKLSIVVHISFERGVSTAPKLRRLLSHYRDPRAAPEQDRINSSKADGLWRTTGSHTLG